jgi:hypothetical protein
MSLADLKSKLGKSKVTTPKVVLDMTLADSGDILADTPYLAKVVSARVIVPQDKTRTPKIDLCVEALDDDLNRIGVINEDLYLSIRARKRLKEFLLSAELTEDAVNPQLDAEELCERLPGKMLGIYTSEGINTDGTKRIEIASFVIPEEVTLEVTAETDKL